VIRYEIVPGILKGVCKDASEEKNKDKTYFLMTDKINTRQIS
jgi:hypothetical protein